MKQLLMIITLLIILFSLCGCNFSDKKQPIVKNGVLDLRDWDFDRDGPVKINGEWKFFWKKFVPLENINNENDNFIKVPTSWNNQVINKQALPNNGFATYYVRILKKTTTNPLALKFLTIGSAYECYVNGKIVQSGGEVGKTRDTMKAAYNPSVAEIFSNSQIFDIVIYVSNFHQEYSGIWLPIEIGDLNSLINKRENNLFLVFFTLGLCIIMFLYYSGLFALRPKERITMYFALFCLFMGIRNFSLEELAILKFFPDITLEIIIKLHYMTFYLSVIMTLKFLYNSFPLDFNKTIIKFYTYFFGSLSLLVILTPATIFTKTLLPAQFLFMTSMIYALIINIKTLKRKRKGSIPIFLGFLAIYLASINDILLTWQVLSTTNLISYAFLVMLFFQSYMITLRFSDAFNSVEMLSIKLDKKNIELQDMNINLENKVKERTEELEQERNKLKKRNEEVENELTLAKVIQQEFIPSSPPFDFISTFYKTMKKVGGDFYDFIYFEDPDEIGIFLSDVSGHGIPAAFITSMIKTIILQAGPKRNDPAKLLTYINEILYNNTAGNFITAFYGIYNIRNRTIIYSNAGHNKPFIINDNVYKLEGKSRVALATFPNSVLKNRNSLYVNNKEILPKGSKLILYTDGLTETKPINGNEFFENSKIYDIFMDNKNLDCTKFVNILYEELINFRKGDFFDDDICVICLDVI